MTELSDELAAEATARAKEAVYEAFPEMAGVEPTVDAREAHAKGAPTAQARHVLTFQKSIPLPDGGCLTRTVRATLDADGKVVKLTSSR